eukprot:TRINITY_DN653_c1_g1_i5.p1 TRINITY_DN653_c1_g1~~TRINITY_DN653_c1_g1_i5.p1  ORF type:complete len:259 (+),score=-36.14 TRINITY_DN653_c1_g1_i5:329-1105(+)
MKGYYVTLTYHKSTICVISSRHYTASHQSSIRLYRTPNGSTRVRLKTVQAMIEKHRNQILPNKIHEPKSLLIFQVLEKTWSQQALHYDQVLQRCYIITLQPNSIKTILDIVYLCQEPNTTLNIFIVVFKCKDTLKILIKNIIFRKYASCLPHTTATPKNWLSLYTYNTLTMRLKKIKYSKRSQSQLQVCLQTITAIVETKLQKKAQRTLVTQRPSNRTDKQTANYVHHKNYNKQSYIIIITYAYKYENITIPYTYILT